MMQVLYSCPYVPAEWISAHGLRPVRIMPGSCNGDAAVARLEGMCPFVLGFLNEVIPAKRKGTVVMTTMCDQTRRGCEILADQGPWRTFLLNLPSTRTDAAKRLYESELHRLGRFCVELGGEAPSPGLLAEVMSEYDSLRRRINAARGQLNAREYTETVSAFGLDGPAADMSGLSTRPEGIPLAIVGGPLMREDLIVLDMIEDSGGTVVLDATETGERGLCPAFDTGRLPDEPFAELVRAYFDGIVDASQRPDEPLHNWLAKKIAERQPAGIILYRHLWCDNWHAEATRIRQWSHLPVLEIEALSDGRGCAERTSTRINAFLESLA